MTNHKGPVWLQQDLGWVDYGFVHRLPADADAALGDLRRLGFRVYILDGTRIADRESFHVEAARVFGFPSRFGRNWDAFDEDFDDVVRAGRTAVVWTEADRLAKADLETFAEAVCMFSDHRRMRREQGRQLELFLAHASP